MESNKKPTVFLLSGEVGAGKTHWVKDFCRTQFGIDAVTSPTFTIVNQYREDIFHLDLYRIENEQELDFLNLEEILSNGNWVFVEWHCRLPKRFLVGLENIVRVQL